MHAPAIPANADILEGIFNCRLTPTEEDMMLLFRVANAEDDIQMTETLSSAVLAVLKLGGQRRVRNWMTETRKSDPSEVGMAPGINKIERDQCGVFAAFSADSCTWIKLCAFFNSLIQLVNVVKHGI